MQSFVSGLFDAALGQSEWNAPIQGFCDSFGFHGAVLISMTDKGRIIASSSTLLEGSEKYQSEHWHQVDDRYRGVDLMMSRGIAVDLDFMTLEEMARSTFYQDFLRKLDLKWWAGIKVPATNGTWCLSLQRSEAQGPVLPSEFGKLLQLVPSFSQALLIQETLEKAKNKSVLDVLDQLGFAAFLLGRSQRVLQFNSRAQATLGSGLVIIRDQLRAATLEGSKSLERALSELIASDIIYLTRDSGKPLVVQLIRLTSPTPSLAGTQTLVLVSDPKLRNLPDARVLQRALKLSSKEGIIAELLVKGISLNDIADTLHITKNTARQHLKSMMEKTQTHRQSEFILLASRMIL